MVFRNIFTSLFSKQSSNANKRQASPAASTTTTAATPTLAFTRTRSSSSTTSMPSTPPQRSPQTAYTTDNVSLDDFTVLKLIASGASGAVYLARVKSTSELVAIKVIKKEGRSDAYLQSVVREQQVQNAVMGDDKFTTLVASWHDENNFYIVTKYCPGGDMALELYRCPIFDAARAQFYAAEMVLAIESLHNQNIIHRDIKPSNILWRADGHIVLAGFGMSKIFAPSSTPDLDDNSSNYSDTGNQNCVTNEICGSSYYMAPEVHYGENYSFEVDFWSMGITLFRMITGRMPFGVDANNMDELARDIAELPLMFTYDDYCRLDVVTLDFLDTLLMKNPKDRLTLEEIKAHDYFKGINWKRLAKRKAKAPWRPFIEQDPKDPQTMPPISVGAAYDPTYDPLPGFTFASAGVRAKDGKARSDCSAHSHGRKFVLTAERFGNVFSGRRKESASAGGQRVAIHTGPGTGKFFLGLRGSPVSSSESLDSDTKTKTYSTRSPKTASDCASLPRMMKSRSGDVLWSMKKLWGTAKSPQQRTVAEILATGDENWGNMLADEL